jgi:hypothetical protein
VAKMVDVDVYVVFEKDTVKMVSWEMVWMREVLEV